MKFIHITDLHLVAPFEALWGLKPFDRLDACLTDVATWHGDAEFCVISGDLTERGEPDAYKALRERLESFPLKTFLMVGNHDDRTAFVKAFPDHPRDANGFVQFEHRVDSAVFLFLDTLKVGAKVGEFCALRREWLSRRLADAQDAPVYIFMHHPPFDIEIPYMDRIKLDDPDAFAATLGETADIRHIFFGHVHRPVYANWKGIPATALPALCHQIPLRRESVNSRYSDEPPMYAVVDVFDDRLVINADCFLNRADTKMPPNKR